MRWVTVVVLSTLGATARSDAPSIRLAAAPERGSVVLLLGAPPAALVQETLAIALPPGQTTLALSWAGTKLAGDSIRLGLADPSVHVAGPRFPAAHPQQAEWTLNAAQGGPTEVTFEYLMGGLTWEPEYSLLLSDQGAGLLSGFAVVRNDTGEDFRGAQIDLGLPNRLTADLEQGRVLRAPYLPEARVACRLVHVFEGAASPDTSIRVELANTTEAGLGVVPLPAGKMRLFEDRGGDRLLMGEVRLPATPVDAETEFTLGTARELSVERRVLRVADVDVKQDVHGRMALWNREEEVAFLVESRKNEDVLLRIVETLDGEWKMLSNSHEFEPEDAARIEFIAPIPAHSEVTVKYKVRRLNLMP
ncbi:MAG: DUF4139 domain-containing protein [Armatimonadetes bacterium]|nr:DUF4139 domain-containing protein [Armatimonadota bacterium]